MCALSDQHYPLASITMLSNSKTQKVHIDAVAKEKGFTNVQVITGDVNTFDFDEKARCVVSLRHTPNSPASRTSSRSRCLNT